MNACDLNEDSSSSEDITKDNNYHLTKRICIINPNIKRIQQKSKGNSSKKSHGTTSKLSSSQSLNVKVFDQKGTPISEQAKSELIE